MAQFTVKTVNDLQRSLSNIISAIDAERYGYDKNDPKFDAVFQPILKAAVEISDKIAKEAFTQTINVDL